MEPKLIYETDGQPVHFSVGAIIKNEKGEYLLIDRLKKPFGFACPAGHVDEGETPLIAIIREVEEETGLKPLVIEETEIGDCSDAPKEACSRGIVNHVWYLYNVTASGELVVKADEVKSIGWYSIDKIKTLPMESIWKYWFTKLKLI
jgi:ADP-ribose pyrophosphatase YjhB (NUDIX family)